MSRTRAYSLIEVVALLIVVVVILALVTPGISHGRSSRSSNSTLRGIHQSLVIYAQGNGGYYPGLDPQGADVSLSVESRYEILLKGNYFPGDYAISPLETKTAWTTGPVTTANYSYAMLQIPAAGGRRVEWAQTLNADAIVMSDRNTGSAASPSGPLSGTQRPSSNRFGCSSPFPSYYGPGWAGAVVYNDNSARIEDTSTLSTQYGAAAPNKTDDLFTAAGDDDAMMIHSGNAP